MHRLVLRQLRRHFGDLDSVPKEWAEFVQAISDTYENSDQDRLLLERSLDLTSQELIQRLEDQKKAEEESNIHLERAETFQILNSLLNKITGNMKIDEILSSISEVVVDLTRSDHAIIFLLDDESQEFVRRASNGIPDSDFPLPIKAREEVTGSMVKSEQTLVSEFETEYILTTYTEWVRGYGMKSYICYPLNHKQKMIGLIGCASTKYDFFSQGDMGLLTTLASHAVVAIEKSRLLFEAEARAARLEIIERIARTVGSELEPEALFKTIMTEIRRAVPCDHFAIARYIPDGGIYRYYLDDAVEKAESSIKSSIKKIQPTGQISGIVYQTKQPHNIPDLLNTPLQDSRHAQTGYRSVLVIPILQDDECTAHMLLASRQPAAFTSGHEELLVSVATHLGTAIRNATLYQQAERRASRLAILNKLNLQIAQNINLTELLESIARSAVELTNGENSRIFLLDEKSQTYNLIVSQGDISENEMSSYEPGQGFVGIVAQTGEAVHVPDLQLDPRWINRAWARNNNIHSYIAQPVFVDQKCVVVINCVSREIDFFDHEDLELLGALAAQAAVAMQNTKLHEEEKKTREFLNRIVSDTADPIIAVDLDGNILLWNSGAENLYGYSAAEMLGRSIDLIVSVEEGAKRARNVEHLLCGEGSFTYESEHLHRDGTPVPVSITVSTINNEKGEAVAISGIHSDLTERKQTEETLRLAKEEAEAANVAKSEFLSNVSHELRSPLVAVLGFSEILMEDSKDPLTHQLLPKIQNAGKHLSKLIDDLRDMDRIEAGKFALEFSEISPNDLIDEIIEHWSSRVESELTLICDLDQDIGMIVCDPTRFRQILNNLIDNAVKFTPDHGTIHISSKLHGSDIWISVQDEGMGLSAEDQQIIFERFSQVEKGYRRSAGGLGIGLYLVRELLNLHEGRIWVDSKLGKGSKFTIALPLGLTTKEKDVSGPASSKTTAIDVEPWMGRRILIVDDLEILHLYMRALMKNEAEILSAYNGEEGIEMATRELPDAILMDIRMPVMDGIHATKQLKAVPETRDIPVVVVTAQAMEEDKELVLAAGADGFITKPIDLETFRNMMKAILR